MPRKRPTTEAEWEQKRAEDRARYHANPGPAAKANKKWSKGNRDRINELRRIKRAKIREMNPLRPKQTKEEKRAKRILWENKNRKRLTQDSLAWYRKNRDKVMERRHMMLTDSVRTIRAAKTKEWKKSNPSKVRASNLKRDELQKTQIHPSASHDKMDAIYAEASAMSKGGVSHQVDHIIPLSKKGWHHEDNLQAITRKMNVRKRANPFWLSPHPGIKDWRDVPRELWPVDLVPKYLALLEQHKGESIRWDVAA